MFNSCRHLTTANGNTARVLELTLALIKPDACANPYVLNCIRQMILNSGLYFVKSRLLHLKRSESEQFYVEHKGSFFYNRLVTFMSSGPIYAHILAGHQSVSKWRTLMGPTKSYRAQFEAPGSIRGRFGLTDTRNATHGSDSVGSACKEIRFFFPKFDVECWYETEEPYFRSSDVSFDDDAFEHRKITKV